MVTSVNTALFDSVDLGGDLNDGDLRAYPVRTAYPEFESVGSQIEHLCLPY